MNVPPCCASALPTKLRSPKFPKMPEQICSSIQLEASSRCALSSESLNPSPPLSVLPAVLGEAVHRLSTLCLTCLTVTTASLVKERSKVAPLQGGPPKPEASKPGSSPGPFQFLMNFKASHYGGEKGFRSARSTGEMSFHLFLNHNRQGKKRFHVEPGDFLPLNKNEITFGFGFYCSYSIFYDFHDWTKAKILQIL